ncbi:MAG: hypothetical protein ACP5OP_02830 [Leptospirillia bacterium]
MILSSDPGERQRLPPVGHPLAVLEETVSRLRDALYPRIEWFRVWFRLRRVSRRRAHLFSQLGKLAAASGAETTWPNTSLRDPQMDRLIEKISLEESRETHLREWLEYLEDREVSSTLSNLQESLIRRTVTPRILLITRDSPYTGRSIADIRKTAASDGTVPVTAMRGSLSVELGPHIPLLPGDRLLLLSAWRTLRNLPPSSAMLRIEGSDTPDPLSD